jgi:hypothetical protein
MLYKFKSKATGDLIMLEPNGRRVLDIIGKSPETSGIIEPLQMARAIQALELAIRTEEAARNAAVESALSRGDDPPAGEVVSLRQRATPFIEMLRRCEKAEAPIVWGV